MLSMALPQSSVAMAGETLHEACDKSFRLHRSVRTDEAEAFAVGADDLGMRNGIVGFREIAGGEMAELVGISAVQHDGKLAARMGMFRQRLVLRDVGQIGAGFRFLFGFNR